MLQNNGQISIVQALYQGGRIKAYHDEKSDSVYILEFNKPHQERGFLPVKEIDFKYLKQHGYLITYQTIYTSSVRFATLEEFTISALGATRFENNDYAEVDTYFSAISKDETMGRRGRRNKKRKKKKNKTSSKSRTTTYTYNTGYNNGRRGYNYYGRGYGTRSSRWTGFGFQRGPETIEQGLLRRKVEKEEIR